MNDRLGDLKEIKFQNLIGTLSGDDVLREQIERITKLLQLYFSKNRDAERNDAEHELMRITQGGEEDDEEDDEDDSDGAEMEK